MPSLTCSVQNCTHNKNNCCCISNIKVNGAKAKKADNTCCESFMIHRHGVNLNETTCACLSIDCAVKNCAYNKECVCHADRVDICGNEATKCMDTECNTFKKK